MVLLLLMTATPMFNGARDVLDLINLLWANDKTPDLRRGGGCDRDGSLKREGEMELAAAARGYVSYARGSFPYSFPMRLKPSD